MSIPLMLLAQTRAGCACADAARIQVGPLSIPVGPLTFVVGLAALIFVPAAVSAWLRQRQQARDAAAVLAG
jgi:hypothetical protein